MLFVGAALLAACGEAQTRPAAREVRADAAFCAAAHGTEARLASYLTPFDSLMREHTGVYSLEEGDQAMIARYLEARAAWRAQMANIAHVVPAEDFTAIGGGKVEANIGRTEGYFVRGKSLTYTLGPLPVVDYAVYGRLCHLGAKNGSLKFSHAGETQTVAIHADPQWRHVRIDDIAIKAENASCGRG